MTTAMTRRGFHALALGGLAATASSPTRAAVPGTAVLEIGATLEGGAEMAAPAGTSARLRGTFTGGVHGACTPPSTHPAPAVALPRLVLRAIGGPGGRVYDLAPVVVSPMPGGTGFTAEVDLAIEWGGFDAFTLRPDWMFRQGTGPDGPHTQTAWFIGTLAVDGAAGGPLAAVAPSIRPGSRPTRPA